MTGPLRVMHVNDVAGVGSAAVDYAAARGLPWRLWPLPPVRDRALPVKVWTRARDLAAFRAAGRSAQVLHIHYGLFGYYAWIARRPYVLHLHGTDVRINLRDPRWRWLVRRAIAQAAAVVYSTPDMEPDVRGLRPDAVWVPAPLHPEVLRPPAPPAASGRARPTVVFASRWDPVKGLDEMVAAASALRATIPEADVVGVDWGVGAGRARRAGVRLLPMLSPSGFRELLASADIVIGQQHTGALGIADLEALALGRPLVARFTHGAAYGGDPPLWNTARIGPVEAVAEVLADPAAAGARATTGREWALRHHSPEVFVRAVLPLYRAAAGGWRRRTVG